MTIRVDFVKFTDEANSWLALGAVQMTDSIIVQDNGGWTEIRLNRPDQLNALDAAMHADLRAALSQVAADKSCRAVLLSAAGRGFCAGQDLAGFNVQPGQPMPDLEEVIRRDYNPLVRQLRAMPKPVIAAVNGVAAGAGAALALHCDIVIAARSAKFVMSFAKIGLIPDAGSSWLLSRLVGEARAKGFTLTGTPISAEQAHLWGLIWQLAEEEGLYQTAADLAADFASGPTAGLALTKQMIQEAAARDLDAHLEAEATAQGEAGRSHDYAEGVAAFFERRKPTFRGE